METPPPLTPLPETNQSNESDRSWCIGLHLSGLLCIPPFGLALAHIIAPLVIWLIKRADSPVIDATGKEVLNFQISFTIYFAIAGALCWLLIGFLILPVFFVIWLACIIIAAIKTSNGGFYLYPMTIRFLR